MADDEDHYKVLGLPSGEEGMKLTDKDIQSAYRTMAKATHPDKNPDDPLAKSRFQRLRASYDVLRDAAARKAFDDLLRVRIGRARREAGRDSKRRRMVSDLEERERAAASGDYDDDRFSAEEARVAKALQQELARLRAMAAKKQETGFTTPAWTTPTPAAAGAAGVGVGGKEKILKVSWARDGVDYSAARLKELFGEFGEVEDVVILEKKKSKRRSALVVMASQETAALAAEMVCGDPTNPLEVNLMVSNVNASARNSNTPAEPESTNLSHLVGAGYQANENSILEKMRKAAERQRNLKNTS